MIESPITGFIMRYRRSAYVFYKDGCKHLNLAANVCGYTPINLGKIIKSGILSDIDSIHRVTIDHAIAKKDAENN